MLVSGGPSSKRRPDVLLTEATGATLLTADRRLAAAVTRAALIPGDWPPSEAE